MNKRILVIDDDTKIASALVIRLRAAGYEVTTAPSGMDGLKAALNERPDLVISDIWMPDGLGFVAMERLKHFGLADVPIFFITASKEKELLNFAKDVGAAGFFEKPFNTDALLAAVASTLKNKRQPEPLYKS